MSTRKRKSRKKPVEILPGGEYVAKVRISTSENVTLADPGETCEKVPENVIPDLLEAGRIERKRPKGAGDEGATDG